MAIVTTQEEFRNALTSSEPEIILANDIILTSAANITYDVTIKGETPGLSLFWGNPTTASRAMLVVTGTLTIEEIILDAQNRDGTLVQINGGTLIMNQNTIVRNVNSMSAQSGVKIGSLTTFVGGTLIMNSGLITGIDSADAVFCSGGSIVMNNDAMISGNAARGVNVTKPFDGGERGSLTMTGNSGVIENRSRSAVGGVAIMEADMYMGVNEGDAPKVSDNSTPLSGEHYTGGIYLSGEAILEMRYKSKVSGNYTCYTGGGITAQNAVITMYNESAVENNVCDESIGGGIRLLQGAKLILEDNAYISGNSSTTYGGGVYVQSGAHLELKGNSSIFENTSLTGGGIVIRQNGRVDLMGNSRIFDNEAEIGRGIYKEGILNVSQSSQVLDGLFFEDLNSGSAYQMENSFNIRTIAEPSEDNSHFVLKVIEQNSDIRGTSSILQNPAYADNVPVIADQLTDSAAILLESSEYVSPPNVPLVIADKGIDYTLLSESDRAAWRIPSDFGLGYKVILNEELNQVLIDYEVYNILYYNLFEADNSNPDSYSEESDFPIVLQAPSERSGYTFAGWYDDNGQSIREVVKGTTKDLMLIALWHDNKILFHL